MYIVNVLVSYADLLKTDRPYVMNFIALEPASLWCGRVGTRSARSNYVYDIILLLLLYAAPTTRCDGHADFHLADRKMYIISTTFTLSLAKRICILYVHHILPVVAKYRVSHHDLPIAISLDMMKTIEV